MLTYTSTKWVNGSGSPLNATNLNNIEQGIDALVGAVNTIEGTVEAHSKEIAGLKTVDATNATNIDSNKQNIAKLTTDLAATNTQVADHETRVDVLEATVGNSTTGLVKRVTTLETDSATKVALKSATDRIGNLEATYASDTELLAVDTRLQADIDEVDERLKARIATAEQDIVTLKNSTGGGGASTWEDLAGKPSAFNPTAHADGNASTYGAATESLYGHVKISNGDVSNTAHASGVAAGMDHTHSNYATKEVATTSSDGLFSATDKTKLEGIAAGANKTVITNNLTTESTTSALSASQGKVLKGLIDNLATKAGTGDMSTVIYDVDGDGKVDNANNADKFDGHSVSEFAMVSHNHEQTQVIGLSTALAGKSDVGHTHDYADKAFKSIVVGEATITADDYKDSVELVAGDNVTLSGDATNDKITINAVDTTYTAGTGISLSGTQFSNSGVRSITQDSTDGHKLTINTNGTTATITIPDNNTDTKVTSAANHYAPTPATGSELAVDASSTTSATWDTTALVTGVNIQRDAKGHVTGVTVDSIRMPPNPDTDTTYGVATSSTLGLVKSGGDVTVNSSGVMSVVDDSHNHVISNIDGLQDILDLLTWDEF